MTTQMKAMVPDWEWTGEVPEQPMYYPIPTPQPEDPAYWESQPQAWQHPDEVPEGAMPLDQAFMVSEEAAESILDRLNGHPSLEASPMFWRRVKALWCQAYRYEEIADELGITCTHWADLWEQEHSRNLGVTQLKLAEIETVMSHVRGWMVENGEDPGFEWTPLVGWPITMPPIPETHRDAWMREPGLWQQSLEKIAPLITEWDDLWRENRTTLDSLMDYPASQATSAFFSRVKALWMQHLYFPTELGQTVSPDMYPLEIYRWDKRPDKIRESVGQMQEVLHQVHTWMVKNGENPGFEWTPLLSWKPAENQKPESAV